MKITPQWASRTLEGTDADIDNAKVGELVERLATGTFETNDPIVVDQFGVVRDGVHRLVAIIVANIPADIEVEYVDTSLL